MTKREEYNLRLAQVNKLYSYELGKLIPEARVKSAIGKMLGKYVRNAERFIAIQRLEEELGL